MLAQQWQQRQVAAAGEKLEGTTRLARQYLPPFVIYMLLQQQQQQQQYKLSITGRLKAKQHCCSNYPGRCSSTKAVRHLDCFKS
jgi:hypothetical protein